MARPRGLGRGLASLIPENSKMGEPASLLGAQIELGLIDPNPFQPRRHFDGEELAELAQSIKMMGVLQPILLRRQDERYQLVSGERRVRAARLAGLEKIPAVVRDVSDQEAMEMALVENLQRADLNPIETARAYQRLAEELGWTQEQIGERVGKSRPHIANHLRILSLDEEIQTWIGMGELTLAHAKALLSLDPPGQHILATRARVEAWTVKRLETEITRYKEGLGQPENSKRESTSSNVHLQSAETALRRALGTKVVLQGDGTKGRMVISYQSLEQLEHLMDLLQSQSNNLGSNPDFVV